MSWQDNLKNMLNNRQLARDIFKSFMSRNGYYDKFEVNVTSMRNYVDNSVLDDIDDYLSRVHPAQYLRYCFAWYRSPEGEEYWDNVYEEWKLYWNNTGIHNCSDYINMVAYDG